MSDFASASAIVPAGELRWTGDAPADWTQGRTAFGGIIGAVAVEAATQAIGPDRPIRCIDVAFVAPVVGPFEVEVEILDAGRSATQASVSVRTPDGRLTSRTHVVAGLGRDSALIVPARPVNPPADGDPGEQGVTMPFLEGVTPTFTQHVHYQWVSQAFPFTGGKADDTKIRGWCRHRTAASGSGAVVALLDAWPPTSMIMADRPVPGSTVRWSAHLTGLAGQVPDGAWLWFEADTVHSASGYTTEVASLFLDGELVAWGEQLMAVYDKRSPLPS